MIAFVKGTLMDAQPTGCVVLTAGGVGYHLHLTVPLLESLPDPGAEVAFHTRQVVREDGVDLYGFGAPEDREVFSLLLSIPKLGPKKALAILSLHTPDGLRRVAATEDLAALTAVSGIGAKTGQQILWELKHKLKTADHGGAAVGAPVAGHGVVADALAGLRNLGYAEEEARGVVRAIHEAEPDLDVPALLRKALQRLARRTT
jgi:Holliday junction DNA helicase RuvA